MTGSVATSALFPSTSRKSRRRSQTESPFETMARALDVDLTKLNPQVVGDAIAACSECDCRDACTRWLRDGIWRYDGDPRCPNAGLFHH